MNSRSILNGQTPLFFCVIAVLLGSCTGRDNHSVRQADSSRQPHIIHHKPPGSFSDTVLIDFPAAVFYNPDSLQLQKIKAVTDAGIFESTMHDCFYQMRNSRIVLKQHYPRVRIVEVQNARYLFFRKMDGGNEFIDLDTRNDPCGLFIFDGKKTAHPVDMTNIESELGFYFSSRN